MKKSKILLSLLLVAVMTLSLVSLIACTDNDKDVEIVMWAPSGAQTFYAEWAKNGRKSIINPKLPAEKPTR